MAKKYWIRPRDLREVVSRMQMCHSQELEPVYRKAHRRQRRLFEEKKSPHRIGFFYELVSSAFYGGRLHAAIPVTNAGTIVVDVFDTFKKQIRESKAMSFNGNFNLRDNQIGKQTHLQEQYAQYKLFYDFYVHTAGKFKGLGEEKDIFRKLSDKTLCSIVLPFSLVLQLHQSFDSVLVSRFNGPETTMSKYEEPATILLSDSVNQLFYSPEKFITWLESSPEDYIIERLASPSEFSVEDNPLKQFPVLKISDKNHEKWIKKFLSSS